LVRSSKERDSSLTSEVRSKGRGSVHPPVRGRTSDRGAKVGPLEEARRDVGRGSPGGQGTRGSDESSEGTVPAGQTFRRDPGGIRGSTSDSFSLEEAAGLGRREEQEAGAGAKACGKSCVLRRPKEY